MNYNQKYFIGLNSYADHDVIDRILNENIEDYLSESELTEDDVEEMSEELKKRIAEHYE